MLEVIKQILGNLVTFGPIILLFFLVNLSEKGRTLDRPQQGKEIGILSYILVLIGYFVSFILGIVFYILSILLKNNGNPHPHFDIHQFQKLDMIGFSLWLPSLLAILCLIPAIRRLLARFIPIDPFRRTHAIALAMSMLVFIYFFTLSSIGLDIISRSGLSTNGSGIIAALWSQDLLLVLFSLIGVGWLTTRTGKEALLRLGIVKPTGKQILFGLLLALALVATVLGMEQLADKLGISGDPNANDLTEKLLGPLFSSIPGILTLGLAAALGEEFIFRGALLPRFGLIYTSILFALVHANYGFSISTLVVFLVGICLGLIRQRYNNLIICMIVHAAYNISLGIYSIM